MPEIYHFIYRDLMTGQLTESDLPPMYQAKKEKRRLFRLYQRLLSQFLSQGNSLSPSNGVLTTNCEVGF